MLLLSEMTFDFPFFDFTTFGAESKGAGRLAPLLSSPPRFANKQDFFLPLVFVLGMGL